MKTAIFKCDRIQLQYPLHTSFSVFQGERVLVLGLRGNHQNTLASIISGKSTKYKGTIYFEGVPVAFNSPADANKLGIFTIDRSEKIIDTFTLSENLLFLPQSKDTPFCLRQKLFSEIADNLFLNLNLNLRSCMHGVDCSIYEQHSVIAARAVSQGAKMIVFQNVTDDYSEEELASFLQLLDILRQRGITVILFSNSIPSIFKHMDRVFIMRHATIAHIFEKGAFSKTDLFRALTQDKEPVPMQNSCAAKSAQPAFFVINNLMVHNCTNIPICFSVRPASIVSLIAVQVTTSDWLLNAVFGEHSYQGDIFLDGKLYQPANSSDAIRAGIGMIRSNINDNLFKNFNCLDNLSFLLEHRVSTGGIIENKRLNHYLVYRTTDKFGVDIKTIKQQFPKNLPNITKWKLAILRWLVLNPRLLLIEHPYSNLDEVERLELSSFFRKIISVSDTSLLISSSLISDVANISDQIINIPGNGTLLRPT